jgi:chromosome segregation ATPase
MSEDKKLVERLRAQLQAKEDGLNVRDRRIEAQAAEIAQYHADLLGYITKEKQFVTENIKLRAEIARLRDQAIKLWALLDGIDTLDDACRNNHEQFRHLTREAQQKRHIILSGDEWDIARAALGGNDE